MDSALERTTLDQERLDVAEVYARHGRDLWAYLYRLGIPEADLPDAIQDVLVVVHRRLGTYDRSGRLTTWLFGICLRVASNHRRRLRRRREEPVDPTDADRGPPEPRDPEQLTDQHRMQMRLRRVLDELTPDKRAVFTWFELDGLSCAEIGALLDVPVGTVHSRLHAARRDFRRALSRLEERERHAQQVARRRVEP